MFSDRSDLYVMDNSKITTRLELVLSCTAARSTITVHDIHEDGANKEQLHCIIQQILQATN